MSRPLILITNDDGITSPALDILARTLTPLGETFIVVPDRERSASSQALTLNRPLRFTEVGPRRFSVEGTPTDCVILAMFRILDRRPSLVVSGVNRGANIGDDISYSGTVAAAMEGCSQGIPSLAVSAYARSQPDFEGASTFAAGVATRVLQEGLPSGVILNINYPEVWNGQVRLTRQGRKAGKTVLVENLDPRGREYYWLHEELHKPDGTPVPETTPFDFDAVHAGFVSVTPLQIDRTAASHLSTFHTWLKSLP